MSLLVLPAALIGCAFLWALSHLRRFLRRFAAQQDRPIVRAHIENELYVAQYKDVNAIWFAITREPEAGAIAVVDLEQAKAVIDHRIAQFLCSPKFPSPYRFRLRVADSLRSPSDLTFVWLAAPNELHCRVVSRDGSFTPLAPTMSAPAHAVAPSEGYTREEIRTLRLNAYSAVRG